MEPLNATEKSMKTILQLTSSLQSANGESSRLAAEFVAGQHADNVVSRDLASDPVPHLTAERFGAFLTPAEKRSLEQSQIVAYSDRLIGELKAADVIVLGLPMYNFGLPSTLKAVSYTHLTLPTNREV